MDDRPFELWRLLARLLPKAVRERVYEPALQDLFAEHLERAGTSGSSGRAQGLNRAVGLLLADAVGIALRGPFWRDGRPTRLAGGVVLLIAVGIFFLFIDSSPETPVAGLLEY